MPYYKDIDLLLIHIPKTGGTSVEVYFKKSSNQTLFSLYPNNDILPETCLRNVSLQHQTYNTIYTYRDLLKVDFNSKLKILTVVRNPYTRIISDLFFLDLIKQEYNSQVVYDIIKEYLYKDCHDNHNIPQYKFIVDESNVLRDNIIILHTETLNIDMFNLGYTDFNSKKLVNPIEVNYYDYLNRKSIDLINSFYEKDFDMFKYNKI